MQGIDISGHQKGINLSRVPCDFVIIKATQGKSYINPDFQRTFLQAGELGKCRGIYHYINGAGVDAEIDHFITVVNPYLGSAILCLDWERDENKAWGNHAYCVEMAGKLHERTGIIPFLYMSKAVTREYDWTPVSHCFLWCAQYANKRPTGYRTNPWTDKKGWGAWKAPAIMQYSSCGQLAGYSGRLDLNYTAATEEMWAAACLPAAAGASITPPETALASPEGEKNPPPYDPPAKTLKIGQRRDNGVRWLQYMLNRSGYGLTVDGDFGIRTEAAVVHFQWKQGLTVDGLVGIRTRGRLQAIV